MLEQLYNEQERWYEKAVSQAISDFVWSFFIEIQKRICKKR
jgi:hypothetical protein